MWHGGSLRQMGLRPLGHDMAESYQWHDVAVSGTGFGRPNPYRLMYFSLILFWIVRDGVFQCFSNVWDF